MDQPHPVLPRSISSADLQKTQTCISYVERDLRQDEHPNHTTSTSYFAVTPKFTLTLPSLKDYPKDFREYVFRRLIDHRVKDELESAKVINWCKEASRLIPLSTSGDGNCLLHASSLGMWGFQDRQFILRKAVHSSLLSEQAFEVLYPRWREWREKEMSAIGVQLERSQWEREWSTVVDSVSMNKRGGTLQGLEQFHIFVLANVLRRPIVVYSMDKIHSAGIEGGVTLQKINFQGLYLPLLWHGKDCNKSPLPIAFNGGHYVSLVVRDTAQEYKSGRIIIPITHSQTNNVFPVMFKSPRETDWDVIQDYLNITYVPDPERVGGVACAEIHIDEQPAYLKPLLTGFVDKCFSAYQHDQKQAQVNNQRSAFVVPTGGGVVQDGRNKCKNGCEFYGDPNLNGLCSQCHRKKHSSLLPPVSALRCCNCQTKPGQPDLLGMCYECYHSKKTGSGSGSVERKTSGSSTAPVSDDIRPCRTSGCEFQGTREKSYYCSTCYRNRMSSGNGGTSDLKKGSGRSEGQPRRTNSRDELVLGRVRDNQQQPHRPHTETGSDARPRSHSVPKCPACREFYSSEEYGGLCHGCFMKKTEEPQPKPVSERLCKECGMLPSCEEFNGYCNNCYFAKEEAKKRFSSERSSQRPPEPKPRDPIHSRSNGSSTEPLAVPRDQHREPPPPPDPDAAHMYVNTPPALPPQANPLYGDLQNYQQRTNSPNSTSSKGGTTGQSCFLCDLDQQIAVSNLVCQQHALQMKKAFLNGKLDSPNMERGKTEGYNRGSGVSSGMNTGGGTSTTDVREIPVRNGNTTNGYTTGGATPTGYTPNSGATPTGYTTSGATPTRYTTGGVSTGYGRPIYTTGGGTPTGYSPSTTNRATPTGYSPSTTNRATPTGYAPSTTNRATPTGYAPSTTSRATPTGYPIRQSQYQYEDRSRVEGFSERTNPQSPKMLCRTPGCAYIQIPELFGYCKDCYSKLQ